MKTLFSFAVNVHVPAPYPVEKKVIDWFVIFVPFEKKKWFDFLYFGIA